MEFKNDFQIYMNDILSKVNEACIVDLEVKNEIFFHFRIFPLSSDHCTCLHRCPPLL